MAAMLVFLRDIGPDGCDYARSNQTLVALKDRGFARFGGTRAKPRVEAWHIEREGRDWLAARAAADAAMVL
ncbi:hypothetical protein SFC76_03130 [Sphingomonas sp. CD22]|uniref:hypothetical protein n=1 Tax=Sphingomonas sp. CD22 TaxID=3100214 RepID=UPI002ADF832A|nr:hypothetical protein [Sphingomonas sp. CD22]MEA1083242.1 hypothetical protein [Sphingomonas sp. CD22]